MDYRTLIDAYLDELPEDRLRLILLILFRMAPQVKQTDGTH